MVFKDLMKILLVRMFSTIIRFMSRQQAIIEQHNTTIGVLLQLLETF